MTDQQAIQRIAAIQQAQPKPDAPTPIGASLSKPSMSPTSDAELAKRQESVEESLRRNRIAALWNQAKVPMRHAKTKPDHTGPWQDAYSKVAAMLGKGALFTLIGPRGSGKTQLAVEAVKETTRALRVSLYTTAMDFFIDLRSTYRNDAGRSERQVFQQYTAPFLLVVDEIHQRGETGWEDRMLAHLIDARYREQRDTILISNQNKAEVLDSLGLSTADRMAECGGVITCNWPSYRQKPAQGGAA